MEGLCRDCSYFEAKGLLIDRGTWGLCKKGAEKDKTGIFRWGDKVCSEFKAKNESSNLQSQSDKA